MMVPSSQRLISIVVPAYNAERFIDESLTSILRQSYRALEIIVCDDASTDGTGALVRQINDRRVRYLPSENNLGGYGAMNRGVAQARGEFVAVYHADDVYGPDIVEREAAFLTTHAEAGAVFCLDRFIDEHNHEYGALKLPATLRGVSMFRDDQLTEAILRYKNTFLRTPSVMFRRAAFEAVGGFDQEGFGIAADLDMWLRLSLHSAIGLIPDHLYSYRHFPQQWSRIYDRLRTEPEMYFAVMDRHLSRPGIRDRVSAEAVARYEAWRVKDETERASNALMLGDPRMALAILDTTVVAPILRSSQKTRVARVLALRGLVRAAARAGAGPVARGLVYFARFRRLPPRRFEPPVATATHTLAVSDTASSPKSDAAAPPNSRADGSVSL